MWNKKASATPRSELQFLLTGTSCPWDNLQERSYKANHGWERCISGSLGAGDPSTSWANLCLRIPTPGRDVAPAVITWHPTWTQTTILINNNQVTHGEHWKGPHFSMMWLKKTEKKKTKNHLCRALTYSDEGVQLSVNAGTCVHVHTHVWCIRMFAVGQAILLTQAIFCKVFIFPLWRKDSSKINSWRAPMEKPWRVNQDAGTVVFWLPNCHKSHMLMPRNLTIWSPVLIKKAPNSEVWRWEDLS